MTNKDKGILLPKFESEEEARQFFDSRGTINPLAIHTTRIPFPSPTVRHDAVVMDNHLKDIQAELTEKFGNKIIILTSADDAYMYGLPEAVADIIANDFHAAYITFNSLYKARFRTSKELPIIGILYPYDTLYRLFVVDYFDIETGNLFLNELLYRLKHRKDDSLRYYVIMKGRVIKTL